MTFLLFKNYDHYTIRNDDADFLIGQVSLRANDGETSESRKFSLTWA